MSSLVSAFARYSQEFSSTPQTDSILSPSRKRKRTRVSMINSNGHSKEIQQNKNRSMSLQPLVSVSQVNGQSNTNKQSSTNRKEKHSGTKFLSSAFPTPYPQRRVIISKSCHSQIHKSKTDKTNEDEEDEVRK